MLFIGAGVVVGILALFLSVIFSKPGSSVDSPGGTAENSPSGNLEPLPSEPGWTENEPGFDPNVMDTPTADEISEGSLISYRGLVGDYTFGTAEQPDGLNGIVLAPTYRARKGQTDRMGMFLLSHGCTELYQTLPADMSYDEATNTIYCENDPIIFLKNNFSFQLPIMYKDKTNFGIAWTLDELGGDYTGAEESWITIRAVELRYGTVRDVINLHFGKKDGEYALLEAVNATVTDPEIIRLASDEVQKSLCYSQDSLFPPPEPGQSLTPEQEALRSHWHFPEAEGDYQYQPGLHNVLFFVQKLDRPYMDRYIDIKTGDEKHYSYLEGLPELYGVTCNTSSSNTSFTTLYMIPDIDPLTGEKILLTIGYDPRVHFSTEFKCRNT